MSKFRQHFDHIYKKLWSGSQCGTLSCLVSYTNVLEKQHLFSMGFYSFLLSVVQFICVAYFFHIIIFMAIFLPQTFH